MVKAGFTIKDACPVKLLFNGACFGLGISRSRYYEVLSQKSRQKAGVKPSSQSKGRKKSDQTDRELIQKIQAIKAEHTFWGYRRVRACPVK